MKKKIVPCFVAGQQKPYANCVVVGKTIYISGMNGRSSETGEAVSDTIEGQTWRALEQIDQAMKQAGSSLKNLVKMTTFLKSMKDYQGYRDTEKKYFLETRPGTGQGARGQHGGSGGLPSERRISHRDRGDWHPLTGRRSTQSHTSSTPIAKAGVRALRETATLAFLSNLERKIFSV